MSYTNRGRRGGGNPNTRAQMNQQQQQQPNILGTRRSTNFVAQSSTPQKQVPVTPQPAQKPQPAQQQQTPQQQQQQQPAINFRNQQNQQQAPVKQEAATPAVQKTNDAPNNGVANKEPISAKEFWATRKTIKLSKQEQQRRRNLRLGRLLQPKNAVMIINELVQNPKFNISDAPLPQEGNQYKASVVVDNIDHIGLGRNKNQAKNAAAETAIRYLIRKRKLASSTKSEDGQEKMEVDSPAQGEEAPIPWQHVASLALFKLFNAWGEEPKEEVQDWKPAKKLPDNPETLQPIMLLNQMFPNTEYIEISRSGAPPHIVFTVQCTVNGEQFVGSGPKFKLAKRMAAYAACHKIFNINYPPEVWSPL